MIAQSARRIGRIVTLVAILAAAGGCAGQPPPSPAGARDTPAGATLGERAAGIALQQVGSPYRYGGSAPDGFDCSGLVYYSYGRVGLAVPRTTEQLWVSTEPVNRSELRAGDVLFFGIDGTMAHVGL